MDEDLRFMIAGGGTGGHLYPALAIGAEITNRKPEATVHYIGSKFGLEARVLPERGLSHTLLPISGLQRSFSARSLGRNLLLLGRVPLALLKVRSLCKTLDPNVIVGTGGYASALPIKVGIGRKIPTVIQEQNSYPGLTTRLFAEAATAVYVGSSDIGAYVDTEIEVTGNPVRSEIRNGSKTAGSKLFQLDSERKTVFLFGGSQGSVPLNLAIQPVLPALQEQGIQLLWQTGPDNYEALEELESDTVRIKPYIKEMAHAYALSDIAVARAGALTLSELSVCGMPSIILPLPNATADHQTKNAKTLVQAGAAVMIQQADLTTANLQETIIGLLDDEDKLTAMGAQALSLGKPRATEDIVDKIFEVARS